jgi:hypothetical protein
MRKSLVLLVLAISVTAPSAFALDDAICSGAAKASALKALSQSPNQMHQGCTIESVGSDGLQTVELLAPNGSAGSGRA